MQRCSHVDIYGHPAPIYVRLGKNNDGRNQHSLGYAYQLRVH